MADYFPLAALERERVLVWLALPVGEAKGYVRANKQGRRIVMLQADDGVMERAAPHLQRDISMWRPIDLASWPDPLPRPVTLMRDPPPLLAPELRPKGNRNAPPGEPLLPEAIAYTAPPDIGYEECESRLIRALMTDRALPDTDRAKLKVRSNWPETGYGPGDYPPEIRTRWTPFPQDIADYLTAMAWFASLQEYERRLLRLRARGMSFVRMGEECGGRNDEWARQQYIRAVLEARNHANSAPYTYSIPIQGQARPLVPA